MRVGTRKVVVVEVVTVRGLTGERATVQGTVVDVDKLQSSPMREVSALIHEFCVVEICTCNSK